MTKQRYRFGRRVYIFVDMVSAMTLLITGFLNFFYDALMYFALGIATQAQYAMEVVAIVLLSAAW